LSDALRSHRAQLREPETAPIPESRPARVRCRACFKPLAHCLCELIEPVANRTHVTVLQHPRERFHAIGTARIAQLGLERSQIVVPRDCFTRSLEQRFECGPRTGVLFPGPGAQMLEGLDPDDRPEALVVLDGTWSQARVLHKANAWLHGLPHYSLTPLAPTRYRIRKAPRPEYISTLEAIVRALEVLEPETAGLEKLLAVFDTMIDRQLAHQGRNPRLRTRMQPGEPPRTR
jgi:DTW domain-containing protein YfiP